ncbi:VOC family protein [Streptomyces sp. P38-E01]|uniref:VOC family protein n=1 Tax=Streptomyces tardus TaxID=2780544 RepID=A0A949N725_9ACTN|nr:VOC family protein [Streptomyces tardus]MBU7600589.1 VOC family protein [Streptomyces tardus]
MRILGTSLRICVDDLEAAVPVYERLAGTPAAHFELGAVSVAAVGPFLVMSGPPDELDILRRISATLSVDDVMAAAEALREVGADILVGPRQTSAGRSLVARLPDGTIFEYVDQPDD